ncbi:hypothetical protein [Novipirellula artificiosorum]|nr:hypothetical protein [Novipirellula artificiosorum]
MEINPYHPFAAEQETKSEPIFHRRGMVFFVASAVIAQYVSVSWGIVIPLVLGSIGILLGILGHLPGTRWKE